MPPQQQMWLSLAHSIIITMSLLGNSVIIHIIRSDNAMRTTTNFFILNQACDDLLITITQSVNVFHHIYLDGLWFWGTVWPNHMQITSRHHVHCTVFFSLDPCNDRSWSLLCGESTVTIIANLPTFEKSHPLYLAVVFCLFNKRPC